jgi:hypothetical protein
MASLNAKLIGPGDVSYGDAPRWHGPDQEYVYPGRRVVELTLWDWPSTPENCEAAFNDTTWLLEGTVLVCNGCGLDST